MEFRPAGWAIVVAALAACLAQGAAAGERQVYVLSQAGAALSAIAEDGDRIAFSIPLDKAPAALALAPGTEIAYVTHPDLGQVSVVDLAGRRVLRTLAVAGSPFGIAAAKDGRLFVADWNGAHVSVLDTRDGGPAKTIAVGRAPAHVVLTSDETRLFVANRESNSVSVVRTADLSIAATIPVDKAPFALALSPDGRSLYVGNVQSGTVSVIDTERLEVMKTLPSGAMPYGAAVTPDGARTLITNQQANTVSVLQRGGVVPGSIEVGGYPEGIAVSPDGTRAYVANWFSDDISVIDLGRLLELNRIKCPAGPRGIAMSQPLP